MSGATEGPPAASPRCFIASFMERTATSRLAFEVGSRSRSPRAFACSTADRLRLAEERAVGGELVARAGRVSRRMTFQVPLMISFWSSASLSASWAFPPALLRLLRGRARGLFALAEDFLEVADLGEVHVAVGAPGLAVGAHVLRPDEIGDELVGGGLEPLEVDQMIDLDLLRPAAGPPCSARRPGVLPPPW